MKKNLGFAIAVTVVVLAGLTLTGCPVPVPDQSGVGDVSFAIKLYDVDDAVKIVETDASKSLSNDEIDALRHQVDSVTVCLYKDTAQGRDLWYSSMGLVSDGNAIVTVRAVEVGFYVVEVSALRGDEELFHGLSFVTVNANEVARPMVMLYLSAEYQTGTGAVQVETFWDNQWSECEVIVNNGKGTCEVSPAPSPGTSYYPLGTTVTITATPTEGYEFSYWYPEYAEAHVLPADLTQNPLVLELSGDVALHPVFVPTQKG
jgi:hypothetical protein